MTKRPSRRCIPSDRWDVGVHNLLGRDKETDLCNEGRNSNWGCVSLRHEIMPQCPQPDRCVLTIMAFTQQVVLPDRESPSRSHQNRTGVTGRDHFLHLALLGVAQMPCEALLPSLPVNHQDGLPLSSPRAVLCPRVVHLRGKPQHPVCNARGIHTIKSRPR